MKRLTFISIGITVLGFLLTKIATYIEVDIFAETGNSLMGIGLLMIYVFLIAWQAEVGRVSVIITSTALGLFFLSFMIYGFIKADEAERNEQISYEIVEEKDEQIKKVMEALMDANDKISSLEAELEACNSSK